MSESVVKSYLRRFVALEKYGTLGCRSDTLILSGHVYGDQIRLPFLGGLYNLEEGLFPTDTKGMFECGNGTIILSAGLGTSGRIPRINNLLEIVVCKVGKEEKENE